MRRQNLLPALFICAPLLFASCGGGRTNSDGAAANNAAATNIAPNTVTTNAPATPTPQRQEVTARVEEVRLKAGGAAEAVVRLDIAEGYHVQANPASDKFYVATEVRAEPQGGVTPGKPVYPPGLKVKLSFSDKPLLVYEGSAVIRLPLRADASAEKGRRTLRAKVRVQPCNDRECQQPREIDAPVPLTID